MVIMQIGREPFSEDLGDDEVGLGHGVPENDEASSNASEGEALRFSGVLVRRGRVAPAGFVVIQPQRCACTDTACITACVCDVSRRRSSCAA